MKHSIRKFISRILPWIVLVHVALFLAFWLTNRLFYSSTNDYLSTQLGTQRDYISLILIVSASIGIWCGFRLGLARWNWIHPLTRLTNGLFGIFSIIYLVFFYGSFALLLHESPVQKLRLIQLLGYYRILLDPLALLMIAWLIGRVLTGSTAWKRTTQRQSFLRGIASALVIYLVFWLIPVFLPPGSVIRGAQPAKPRIIAHRGASMLAPENTLAAAQLAASLGVYGLETDIHISQDGQPYLMHDDTLKRTTNISSVFPGRENDRAETFTLEQVRLLNAGDWFVQQDPFKAISQGVVSQGQVDEYRQQKIPTLAEELSVIRQHHLEFIFDLKQPPENHPYNQSFFEIVLQQIQNTGIDPQVWFLVDPDQLSVIQKAAPQMKATAGIDYRNPPPPEKLKEDGYQIVNAEYGLATNWIREYQATGLWVNLYTVDEPWQFSRLWLLGVDSITTSNAQAMVGLEQPMWSLPYSVYLSLWGLVGFLGVLIILGMTLRGFRTNQKVESSEG